MVFNKSAPYFSYPNFLVLVIAIIASFFSFYNIAQKNIWLDEAISIVIAKMPWGDFWKLLTTSELNMWFYFVLLKLWIGFGDTEFAVRSLSALFAIASIPVLYGLAKRLFGVRVGLFSILLISVNAFFVAYSQEARGYSLVLLLVSLDSYLFVRITEDPFDKKFVFSYVIISVLAVYTHLFASLVLIAHTLSSLALPKDKFRLLLRPLMFANFLIAILLMPVILLVFSKGGPDTSWIQKPNISSIKGLIQALSGDVGAKKYHVALYLFSCSIFIVHLVSCIYKNRRSLEAWRVIFIFLWMVVPIALLFGISYIKPLFLNRYLIISFPAFVLTVSLGLSLLEDRHAYAILLALIVFLSISSTFTNYYNTRDKFDNGRDAAVYLMSNAQRGDAVLFYKYYAIITPEYYIKKANPSLDILDCVYPAKLGHYKYGEYYEDPSMSFLEGLKERYRRVWIILRDENNGSRFISIMTTLMKNYYVEHDKSVSDIHLFLLVRK